MFKISFFPKDKRFFELFNDLSNTLLQIGETFNELLQTYTPASGQVTGPLGYTPAVRKLMTLEEQAERDSEELRKALFSTFVTPLDREDIHGLTKVLLSIAEHICSASRRFDMYHIMELKPFVGELTEILLKCIAELNLLIQHLDNLNSLERFTPHIQQLSQYEKEADQIYRGAIKALFKNPADTLEVVKWKDIYERLENAVDKCNSASNIIMGIILKYA